MSEQQQQYYTLSEAARKYGIHRRILYRWLDGGLLHYQLRRWGKRRGRPVVCEADIVGARTRVAEKEKSRRERLKSKHEQHVQEASRGKSDVPSSRQEET